MQDNDSEILNILSEECAEVIQAISKIHRFGFDSCHPNTPEKNNIDHLTEELGDLQCMINLLVKKMVISQTKLDEAAEAKLEKLRQWSNIDRKSVV